MGQARGIYGWYTLLLVLCASCVWSSCVRPVDDDPRVDTAASRVLIVGGDQHHDFDKWYGEADVATLKSVGAEASYTAEPHRILPELERLDVLYLSNNQALPGQELRDGIFGLADAGKGLIIGHAAGWYSWTDWPEYNRDLVGGGTRGHRAYGEFDVVVEDAEHPVMRGVPARFTIADELYRFQKDPEGSSIHVLASATEPETGASYPVVWTVGHAKGRIVVNTLGHDGASHEHPAYRQILQNSFRWTSRSME